MSCALILVNKCDGHYYSASPFYCAKIVKFSCEFPKQVCELSGYQQLQHPEENLTKPRLTRRIIRVYSVLMNRKCADMRESSRLHVYLYFIIDFLNHNIHFLLI